MVFIAQQSMEGRRVRVMEIAKATDSPTAFTAKVLQQLARKHMVTSVKGPYGGFEISKTSLDTIKLSDIVKAIDGDDVLTRCALGHESCGSDRPCPLHYKFVTVRQEMNKMLEHTSFRELVHALSNGATLLNV